MPQVPAEMRKARAAKLREAAVRRRGVWLRSLIGSEQAVLVERPGDRGHAGNFADVRLTGACETGSIQNVVVTGVADGILTSRHSRESGSPSPDRCAGRRQQEMGPRFRGDDVKETLHA